jgi:hypothetical protein
MRMRWTRYAVGTREIRNAEKLLVIIEGRIIPRRIVKETRWRVWPGFIGPVQGEVAGRGEYV